MQHRLMRTSKVFSLSIVTILALSLFGFNNALASKKPTIQGQVKSELDNNLLQFKAGNHILGFAPAKVYLASIDHALTIEFLGTKGVMPKTVGDSRVSDSETTAQSLNKVVYQNLWDGISLKYESAKDGLTESTYQVAPGADVSKIRLQYNVPAEKQENGSLKFRFQKGILSESAPIAWQEIGGKRIQVAVAFKVTGDEVGFIIGKYDFNKPLIIDPTYSWNTFYGSGNGDEANRIAIDSSGNLYITGYSYATWYGPSGQLPLNDYNGGGSPAIFVLKLTSGGAYEWHTFYGSDNGDIGNGIAIDSSGNIYVTGYSYGTWGTPLHPFDTSGSVNPDLSVLKLTSNGSLVWNTFYGSGAGDTGDIGNDIAVDGSSNVYVTGYSSGTWGTPLHPFDTSGSGYPDISVLKLTSSGSLVWNTFYGSDSGDINEANGIAVDGSSNIYVTGYSDGTWGTPLNPYNGAGSQAIFVLKLTSGGSLVWNTFYGSDSGDIGNGIAVDGSGNIYVTGYSYGTWGTPLNPFVTSGSGDYSNILVMKLNGSGSLDWNTFYGSGAGDAGAYIALDGSSSVYVTGYSYGTWGTPLNPFDTSGSGNPDISVLKLTSSGSLEWNTFYGSGSGSGIGDHGAGITIDSGGNVYVTGYSCGTWGTPLNPFDTSGSGLPDIFVLKLELSTCPATAVQIEGTGIVSDSIQTVYGEASSGQTIMIQALTINESLNLDQNIDVVLQGGYECNFPQAPPGRATLNGSLTIGGGSGTVTLANFIVQ